MLDGWLHTFDQAIEASKNETVPEIFQKMTEYFPYIFETAGENLPMFLEFWLQASRDETIWDASVAPYRRYHKYFVSLIKKGMAEGSFADVDPDLAARLIVSAAMGLLLQSLLDPDGADWSKVARGDGAGDDEKPAQGIELMRCGNTPEHELGSRPMETKRG